MRILNSFSRNAYYQRCFIIKQNTIVSVHTGGIPAYNTCTVVNLNQFFNAELSPYLILLECHFVFWNRFNQNMFEIQSQLTTANKKISDLTQQNNDLHLEIGDLMSRIRGLEGEVCFQCAVVPAI